MGPGDESFTPRVTAIKTELIMIRMIMDSIISSVRLINWAVFPLRGVSNTLMIRMPFISVHFACIKSSVNKSGIYFIMTVVSIS